MKAITYTKFGPPEVLQYEEVEKPIPEDNEILIRTYAATVCKEDPQFRATAGLNGLRKPKTPILGQYLAGEIEDLGKDVTEFQKGDKVYADTGMKLGAHAEYICMPESGGVVLKPTNMSFDEAAAIPNGGLTALPFLRDKGKIQDGHKVLVNGASGAVGSSAVQLAKYFGAEVTGICSTTNLELVKSLGADFVIDYTQEDFTQNGKTYDIIFDTVGKIGYSKGKSSLKKGGLYLVTLPTLAIFNRHVKFSATGLRSASKKKEDLIILKDIAEIGKLKAVIDRTYPLEQTAEAHRYVETKRKKGNVVISIK